MTLSMIWAMAKNRVIGIDNKLPWHLPNDLQNFKKVTLGKPVIMGLNTFYSLGKPLSGRRNIVLNFDMLDLEGAEVFTSISDAVSAVKNDDAFVIGGASIYKQFLPLVDKLYVTIIDEDFLGDAYFPAFDLDDWKLISKEDGVLDEKNKHKHTFYVYERASSS